MSRLFLTGGSGFIGAEVARLASAQGHMVTIYDRVSPNSIPESSYWIKGDVRDYTALESAILTSQADIVVHLASDTDVQVEKIEQFTTTLLGTENVLRAVKASRNVNRFIHISTQFVVKPGVRVLSEGHFDPYTVYGAAKARTEEMVRSASLSAQWLIIRPTIIWGPNHPSFRENIFRHIASGRYLHPVGRNAIMRTFGYVGNTAHQILSLALADDDHSGRRVYYAGDSTMDYARWADAFSLALKGRPARRVPTWLLRLLGKTGDFMKGLGLRSPIDSGRVFRMSTSSVIDLEPTLSRTGTPQVSFETGVRETLRWLGKAAV